MFTITKFKEEMQVIKDFGNNGEIFTLNTEEYGDFFSTEKLSITMKLFNVKPIFNFISEISDEYIKSREEKNNPITLNGEKLSVVIHNGITLSKRYSQDDFNRYEGGNISPVNEVFGLPISFFKKMNKLFKDIEEIEYSLYENRFIGIDKMTGDVLFVTSAYSMPIQQTIVDPNQQSLSDASEDTEEDSI